MVVHACIATGRVLKSDLFYSMGSIKAPEGAEVEANRLAIATQRPSSQPDTSEAEQAHSKPERDVEATSSLPASRGVTFASVQSIHMEILLLFTWAFLTFLIIGAAAHEPQWILTAFTGSLGAYLRVRLAVYNSTYDTFPVGTFVANITGSWVLAIVAIISRLGTDYHDKLNQAFLFGMEQGFCGCLTTVSTFMVELDSLRWKNAVFYACTTIFLSQVCGCLMLCVTIFLSHVHGSSHTSCLFGLCEYFSVSCRWLFAHSPSFMLARRSSCLTWVAHC